MTLTVDNKTFAIGILSLMAVILLVAVINKPQQVQAAEVVKGRDYTCVTARVAQGDDGLYVVDGKTGLMAVFIYNPGRRQLEPKAILPVADAFRGGAGAGPAKPEKPARGGRAG
jgi:hypothetical protein